MPIDENANLKDIDQSAPLTASGLVSDGAAYIRQHIKAIWKFLTLTHDTDGKLAYGADTGSTNAYVVDLGSVPQLAVNGLYTGFTLRFKAASTNTASATVEVKVSGTDIAGPTWPVTIKKAGANLLANQIVSGDIVELAWDGTTFQLMSGNGLPSKVLPKSLLPPGTRVQLAQGPTSIAPLVNTVIAVDMASYTLPINTFTDLEVDVDVIAISDQNSGRTIKIDLITDAETFTQTFDVNATNGISFRMRLFVPGGQGTTQLYKVRGQLNHASSNFSASVANFSVVGIV